MKMEFSSGASAREVRQEANCRIGPPCCHMKSSSESGRKRSREGNGVQINYSSHKHCRSNCLRTVMQAILVLALTRLAPHTLASSQIRPVWVSAWPESSSRLASDTNKKLSSRFGDSVKMSEPLERPPKWDFFSSEEGKRTRLDELQLAPASKRQLQVAASSLQPSIVSADVGGEQDYQRQPEDERRLSSGSQRFRVAHLSPSGNFTHEASSLDHLWSGNAGPALNQSLTNAQVQFDEDQHQPSSSAQSADRANNSAEPPKDSRVRASEGGNFNQAHNFSRRQDNESHLLSNLNPTHEDYHPILLEAQDLDIQPPRGEGHRKEFAARNKTNYYTDEEMLQLLNQTRRNVSTKFELSTSNDYANQRPVAKSEKLAPTGFYYLPDGDKWNSNNFGTNSNKKSLDTSNKLDAFEQDLNFKLLSSEQSGPLRPAANWPAEQRVLSKTRRLTANPNIYPGSSMATTDWPRAASLSYGFSPSQFASGAPSTQDLRLVGTRMTALHPPASGLPPSYVQSQQFETTMAPVSSQAANFITLVPLNEIPQLRQQLPIHRRMPQNQRHRVVKLGETAPGPRSTKSILRSYSPMQLLGGAGGALKPTGGKKSILATLSNKLNNWPGEQHQHPNVDKMIEQSFFESPARPIRTRPPLDSGFPPLMMTAPSSGLLFRPSTSVRQPTVAPAASFERFYGQASARPLGDSRQSTLRRPHRSGIQQQGSQQPASFIPVVAVQVTRTSPSPNVNHRPNPEAGLPDQHTDTTANEIEEYLTNKVRQRQPPDSINHQLKTIQFDEHEQKWDDSPLGGMSSPSMSSSRTSGQRTRSRSGQNAARWTQLVADDHQLGLHGNHETTVKSAVFGYLPHQARAPLLQAMQFLQQIPADKQHLAASGQNMQQQQELYANQMDRSNQAVDAATPFLNHHSYASGPLPLMAAAGEDVSQASLALQLQPHNYAQNDLAHPFSGFQSGHGAAASVNSYGSMPVSSSHIYNPLGLYSTADVANQLQFLQAATNSQQQPAPASPASHQDSWAQLAGVGANPLLGVQTSGQHQGSPTSSSSLPATLQQQLASLAPLGPDQLMNPSLTAPFFLAATHGPLDGASLESYLNSMQGTTNEQQESLQQSYPEKEAASEPVTGSDGAASQMSQRQNQLSQNKGKKRSGEFFANAGQLLLTALPLLLAPTLGLMFASAQSPAARYQAPNPLGNSAGAPSNYGAHAPPLPINGLADGLVLNASPAPQLFTPTPLGSQANHFELYSHTLDDKRNSKLDGLENMTTSSTTTTTHAPPSQSTSGGYRAGNATASLPALTGLKMNTGGGRNKSSRTSPKPMTIILSTLQPSQNATQLDRNVSFSIADLNSSATNHGDVTYPSVRGGGSLSPTILILEEDEDESGSETSRHDHSTNATNINKPNHAYQLAPQGQHSAQEGVSLESQVANQTRTSSSTTTRAPTILYDIGYEGADFDAQFPSLKRASTSRAPSMSEQYQHGTPTRRPILYLSTVQPQRYVKDKSHYQYAGVALNELTGDEASESHGSHSSPKLWSVSDMAIAGDSGPNRTRATDPVSPQVTRAPEHDTDKLYPVSTWPSLRRRTVSLVTSQGNMTLPDSSERYTANGLNARHQAANEMARQRNRRNKLTSSRLNAARDPLGGSLELARASSAQLQVNAGRPVESERGASLVSKRRRKRDLTGQLDQQEVPMTKKPQTRDKSSKRALKGKKKAELQGAQDAASTLTYRNFDTRSMSQWNNSFEPTNSIDTNGRQSDQLNNSVKLMKRGEQERDTNAPNQSGADEPEPLRRDASKSKSAIVTAMITHVNGEDDQERDQDDRDERRNELTGGLQDGYNLEGSRLAGGHNNSLADMLRHQKPSDEEEWQLREQMLARKMLLDRIATRASALSSDDDVRHLLDEPLNNLQLGARANMRPIPKEEPANYSISHIVGRHPRRRKSTNSMELNEATKRALAKFGTLLLEDTLQVPGNSGEQPRKRPAHTAERQRHAMPDYEQGTATESYPIRATSAPPPLSADLPPSSFDNWSRLYVTRSNHSRNDLEDGRPRSNYTSVQSSYAHPARSPNRQSHYNEPQEVPNDHYETAILSKAHYRQSYNDSFGGRLSGGASGAYADTTLAPVNEFGSRPGKSTGGESPAMSRYNDFLLNNFQPSRSPNGRSDQNSTRHSHTTSGGEQLDARYSTYSNYPTSAPSYPQGPAYYPNERYAYPDRPSNDAFGHIHNYPGVNHSSAWTRPTQAYPASHHHDDPYAPPPPPPPPPPPQMHSHYANDDQYAPSASHNNQPAPFSSHAHHHRHSLGSGWSSGSSPGHPPARFPPPAYQPVEQPNQPTQPPTFGSNHHYRPHFNENAMPRHPSSTTYAPGPAPYGSSHYHSNSHEPTTRASDTRAVNEYLKRVQFSDSDRDKLMASYLTCDNLLNDNDHCLERLSCEFSDPQNIEKANKLDRAVSSILLGHILINTYIPNSFKLRLKSASLFGYTQSGKCSKFACSKLTSRISHSVSTQNE